MLVFQIKVTYQGETHKGAHERNSVADLRIKNGSFARFALLFFVMLCFSFVCFIFFSHFSVAVVIFTTTNDLFCSYVDDLST